METTNKYNGVRTATDGRDIEKQRVEFVILSEDHFMKYIGFEAKQQLAESMECITLGYGSKDTPFLYMGEFNKQALLRNLTILRDKIKEITPIGFKYYLVIDMPYIKKSFWKGANGWTFYDGKTEVAIYPRLADVPNHLIPNVKELA